MVELSRPRLVRVRPGPPPGSHVGEPRYCSYRRFAPRCGTLPGMEPSVGPCYIDYGIQLLMNPHLAARAIDALHSGWQVTVSAGATGYALLPLVPPSNAAFAGFAGEQQNDGFSSHT